MKQTAIFKTIQLILLLLMFYIVRPTQTAYAASLELIGNPHSARYTSSSQYYARGIWDMAVSYDDIYVGGGDYHTNAGPVELWSYNVTQNKWLKHAITAGSQTLTTLSEEEILNFHNDGNTIWLGGLDPLGDTDNWSFGNLYTNFSGSWKKYRTLPNTIHTYDVHETGNQIYAEANQYLGKDSAGNDQWQSVVLRSSNGGTSWTTVLNDNLRQKHGGHFFKFNNTLYFEFQGAFYQYQPAQGVFKKPALFTSSQWPMSYRYVEFNNSGIYIAATGFGHNGILSVGSNLIRIAAVNSSGRTDISSKFLTSGWKPADLKIVNQKLYVLATKPNGDAYDGAIWETADLDHWSKRQTFTTPMPAWSFEYLSGAWYLGLGTPRVSSTDRTNAKSSTGNVYRLIDSLTPPSSPPPASPPTLTPTPTPSVPLTPQPTVRPTAAPTFSPTPSPHPISCPDD